MTEFDENQFDEDILESRKAIERQSGGIEPFADQKRKADEQERDEEKPKIIEDIQVSEQEREMLQSEPQAVDNNEEENDQAKPASDEQGPMDDYYPGAKTASNDKKAVDIPSFDLNRDLGGVRRKPASAKRRKTGSLPVLETKNEKPKPAKIEPLRIKEKPAADRFSSDALIAEIVARDLKRICSKL